MNNRDELQFAYQIRRRLSADVGKLPAATLERLRAGREQALARQRQAVGGVRAAGIPATFSFGWLGSSAFGGYWGGFRCEHRFVGECGRLY